MKNTPSAVRLVIGLLMFNFCAIAGMGTSSAQCVGLPPVAALGSNKYPVGLCAPVNANVTYNVTFTSPTPGGKLELVYDWGDGSSAEIIPLVAGLTSYNTSRSHTFPAQSDCEFLVVATVYYNGAPCTATRQLQKIASWRTDNFNGGEVKLVSAITKSREHLVCEGEPIEVIFRDETNWNCSADYIGNSPTQIETPNTENRWQQIVYNTPVSGNKIPYVEVDGVPITGAGGIDIVQNYQDPRGVFYMASPVLLNDGRRRPSLRITAPGGSSSKAPQANDSFELTIRYWNFCNPYDDPNIPGPPADVMNGDHPPVERTATIRIMPAPEPPVSMKSLSCNGSAPEAFSVANIPKNSIVNWYADNTGRPGSLVSSGMDTSLSVSAHPDWVNSSTAGVYNVWASYLPDVAGQMNCESRKTLVTRTIRELITMPEPVVPAPPQVCNNTSFPIKLPEPPVEIIGGKTFYRWKASNGLTIGNATTSGVTINVNLTDAQFGDKLSLERTITVTREYTTAPLCNKSKIYKVVVYKNPHGGSLSSLSEICETSDAGTLTLSGYSGKIVRWEVSENGEAFRTFVTSSEATLSPGKLAPAKYTFRAVVYNDNCDETYSTVEDISVSPKPAPAFAGTDQFICASLQSTSIGASDPFPGVGVWSVVRTIPQGLPSPEFSDINDPNANVKITQQNSGAYILRWSVTNGACSDSDDVIIDFGTNPSEPDAGNDKNVCGFNTSLDGSTPEKGIGQWTVVSGPNGCTGAHCNITMSNPASPNSTVQLGDENTAYGAYTLRWTINSGGNNCFTKHDEVRVTFTKPLQVFADDVTNVCMDAENLKPIHVDGKVTGDQSIGQWLKTSGDGSLSSQSLGGKDTLNVSAIYYPTMDDYASGDPIQLMLKGESVPGAACLPVSKTINIHFDRKPIGRVIEDTLYTCAPEIELSAEAPLHNATGKWTTNDPNIVFENPDDPKTTISNLLRAPSQIVATWTVVSSGGSCVSDPKNVVVIRHELPEARDVIATLCGSSPSGGIVALSDYEDLVTSLPVMEREITWYSDIDSKTKVMDPEQIRSCGDNEVFIARIKNRNTQCWNDAKLTIDIRPLPAITNSVVELCEDFAGAATVSSIDLADQQYKSAVTSEKHTTITWHHTYEHAVENASSITGPLNIHKSKKVYARVVFNDKEPYCARVATLELKVKSRPATTEILGRESVCQGDLSVNADDMHVEIYQAIPVAGAKYYWEIPDNPEEEFKIFGGGKVGDFYALVQFPNVFTGKIRLVIEVNGCRSNVMEKEISVAPAPVKPTILGSSFACGSDESISFSVSPNNYPSSAYYWEVRRASDNSPGGGYIIEGQSTGEVLVHASEDVVLAVRESNSFCVSAEATKILTMSNPVRAKVEVRKEIDCFGTNSGTIVTEVQGGTYPYTSFELIPGNVLDEDENGTFKNLPAGNYRVRVRDANGCTTLSNQISLEQPSPLLIEDIAVLTGASGFELSAHNASDGEITVKFSGGVSTENYTVSLVHLPEERLVQLQGKDQVTFMGLTHGTYRILVTDANGCSSTPGMTSIENPPPLFAGVIGFDQEVCSGEPPAPITEITSAHGGTGNYTYQWQISSTGNMLNESEWTPIEGATGVEYHPAQLTVNSDSATLRFYRRLVYSKSDRAGAISRIKSNDIPVKIAFYALPVATLSPTAIEICEGEHVTVAVELNRGDGPFEFDFTTGAEVTTRQSGSSGAMVPLYNITSDTTFRLTRLKDRHSCVAEDLPDSVSVNVKNTTADFVVLPASNACDGASEFKWNVEANTEYRWVWGDGTFEEIEADTISAQDRIITHRFDRIPGHNERTYEVMLFAKPLGCAESAEIRRVSVPGVVSLNMIGGDTLLCSGETITFKDQSVGVESGVWYFRRKGVNERRGETVSVGQDATFKLENTSVANPLEYEVVYEVSNKEGCKAVFTQSVLVFQKADANFEAEITKAYSGTVAQVTVTNSSTPFGNFNYQWSFDEQSAARKQADRTFTIDYHTTGLKTIKVAAENIASAALGKSCTSSRVKTVNIQHPMLRAAFEASPRAACFPAEVSAINLSTGADIFHWTLSDSTGVVSHANLSDPTFKIVSPGVYSLVLIATYGPTGLSDTAKIEQIEILDAPIAAFSVRDQAYIGSQIDPINRSENATDYAWQFENETTSMFEPIHIYQQPGNYFIKLIASANHGQKDVNGDGLDDGELVCFDTAQHQVLVLDGGNIKVPNAFTPSVYGPANGGSSHDALNDIFLPRIEGVLGFRMEIFDRWGSLIFISTDKSIGWDGYRHGVLMPAGVYVYKLTLDLANGSRHTKIGDVTLLR